MKKYNETILRRYERQRKIMPPLTMKICSKCKKTLDISIFYRNIKNPDGYAGRCIPCINEQNRKWNNPTYNPKIIDYRKKLAAKRLSALFNLTPEDKQKILVFQNNLCAICKNPMKKPNCDHDHKTGQIRGFLCPMCNRALGRFRDSLERLQAAVEYMTHFPATIALGESRFGLPGRVGTKKQRKLIKKMKKLLDKSTKA